MWIFSCFSVFNWPLMPLNVYDDWKGKSFDMYFWKKNHFNKFLTLYLITNQLNVGMIKQTFNWVCCSRAENFDSFFDFVFNATQRVQCKHSLVVRKSLFNVEKETEHSAMHCRNAKEKALSRRCYNIFYLSCLINVLSIHDSNISSKSTMQIYTACKNSVHVHFCATQC